MIESQTFSIAFIVLAAFLSWEYFDLVRIGSWLFIGGMTFLLFALPGLPLAMEVRRKKTGNTGG